MLYHIEPIRLWLGNCVYVSFISYHLAVTSNYTYVWELLGFTSGEGSGTPLQHSCLENPRGGLWGLPSMGSHRVRHNWSDLAAAAAFRSGTASVVTPLSAARPQNHWKPFSKQKCPKLEGTPTWSLIWYQNESVGSKWNWVAALLHSSFFFIYFYLISEFEECQMIPLIRRTYG